MSVVIVGLPGGLQPRHEQLKELVQVKTIAFYEARPLCRDALKWAAVAEDVDCGVRVFVCRG